MIIPPNSYDAALGLHAVFIEMVRPESVHLKLVLETYEGIAVVRNVEPDSGGNQVRQVLLIVGDFVSVAEDVLGEFDIEVPLRLLEPTEAMREDLRRQLLGELDEFRGCAKYATPIEIP